jgi:adenine-specific DNA glycosylase
MELPVKSKAKARKVEKRTVFVLKDGETVAICKRPKKGLLAGLYELPNVEGHLSEKEAVRYCKKIGLSALHIQRLEDAKHIFSHVEWHMEGYLVEIHSVPEALNPEEKEPMLFVTREELKETYPIPSAFEAYKKFLDTLYEQNVKKNQ